MADGGREIRSTTEPVLHISAVISGNGVTNGTPIDTSGFDGAKEFTFELLDYTDGTSTPIIQEDDDISFSGATTVPAANLIGTLSGATLSAATTQGDTLPTVAVIATTKRYLRVQETASGVSTGYTLRVGFIGRPNIMPPVYPND